VITDKVNSHPAVSVVVPVYNAEGTLDACVRSLLNLDYPPNERELIFVDNGSTDRSTRILQSFGDRIRVLAESKRGPSAARNRGIRGARFPLIAFTDSDCAVDPHWLRHLVAPLLAQDVGVSGGTILTQRPCNNVEAFGDQVHDNRKAITYYKPPFVDTGNWASRAEVLKELSGFDEAFRRAEDCELSCRILQAGFRFVYVPEAIVYHRNESTYKGLFLEGFSHGLHSIPLIERHRKFYAKAGYRRLYPPHYRQLWTHLRDYLSGKNPETAGSSLVFNAGKRVGRLTGSIRFGAIHL
jgi:glycosyltransferase involved in cell wall biosynthesis